MLSALDNPDNRVLFFKRLATKTPHPKTELIYHSPFQLLIAVMLSAQSTDKQVNKVTAQLFKHADTAYKLYALGEDNIRHMIKTLGLFNSKAKHVYLTCGQLIKQHQGEVPATRQALEALPGVGRKTANVVLNTAFGHLVMAVDTHIFRVSNRTGLAPGKNVLAVEQALMQRIPKIYLKMRIIG